LRIGICGLGTVAQGVIELLRSNGTDIDRRAGRPVRLVRVASRTAKPDVDLLGASFTTDVSDVVRDPEIDLVVEVIGGEERAAELFRDSVEAGKHFVTANKALIAVHGGELLRLAAGAGLSVGFEAAVAGGIPIVKTLSEGLAANAINWIAGIINGTSNYILTAMAVEGRSFEDALAEAQALGYAEADPTFDVEGIDAAHKLTILSALAFGTDLDFDAVFTEGIAGVTPEDIEYANELGYQIKHLGITRRSDAGVELRVHPTLVPRTRMLAKVDGVMNAVVTNSDAVGSSLYYGPGAGAGPTASAVLADVIDIARCGGTVPAPARSDQPRRLTMDAVETAYYLKIPAVDEPGVLANVAQILSAESISIEAVIQREQAIRTDDGKPWVPVIIMTHRVQEAAMNRALANIQSLPEVIGDITRFRVEPLDAHA
jgi:homoserine dehydrogenase